MRLGIGGAIGAGCLVAMAACDRQPDLHTRCTAMVSENLPGVTVAAANVITNREDLPGFCQIQGTIDPSIGFEARLPLADWNGKYYQSGCGGYCGMVLPDKPGFSNTINEALKRGYAAITTDSGHTASIGDPSWAKDNLQAVELYGHRSVPLTHRAGTGLVNAFYNTSASREYFSGCSNGGRMAAITAQRYPELFDGILGGAGVLNLSQSGGIYGSWVVQSNTDDQGNRILTRENFGAKIPLLEQEVIAQCDAVDGIADEIIAAPRQCTVDFDALPNCGSDTADQCFTTKEIDVLRAWYQGPRNSNGEQLQPGMPPGGERYIGFWFLDSDDRIAIGNQLGGRYAKYLGFEGGTPDDYTVLDFDFDTDPPKLTKTAEVVDALNPDLREFRDSGGKYLMWHGWGDALVLPDQSLDYYDSVAAEMGGYDAIQAFYRLFLIPGHGHCWEMPADVPDRFDPISTLDQWVESGRAPEHIIAAAFDPETAVATEIALCPHPAMARKLDADVGGTVCTAD